MPEKAKYTRYDIHSSYAVNYQRSAELPELSPTRTPIPGKWRLGNLELDSPLGVAAGPLLNGDWCHYYAALGFDWVTYKTVRSAHRECYPLPNLLPIQTQGRLDEPGHEVEASLTMEGTWAVSFGMPSQSPEFWIKDIADCRARLPNHVKLSVSVVGTMKSGWGVEQLADDYAWCAAAAAKAGADAIEANFSCPNVATCDGQLYQDARQAALVAKRIRKTIPDTPLLLKLGFIPKHQDCQAWLAEFDGVVDGFVMTNSISAFVTEADSEAVPSVSSSSRDHNSSSIKRAFDGQPRGICGKQILDTSLDQISRFAQARERLKIQSDLVGVGGIFSLNDVQSYLSAGADAVQLATSVMIEPEIGAKIKREWLKRPHQSQKHP